MSGATSTDILELSHKICAATPDAMGVPPAAKRAAGRPPKLSSTSDDERDQKKREKLQKEQRAEQEDLEQKKRLQKKIQKWSDYVDSCVFKHVCEELQIGRPKGNESEAVADAQLHRIQNRLATQYKRTVVNFGFVACGKTIGAIGQRLFSLQHFARFPDALEQNRGQFETELEEIAIEMDSGFIPDPKMRLLLQMLAFALEFDKQYKGPGVEMAHGLGLASGVGTFSARSSKSEKAEDSEDSE